MATSATISAPSPEEFVSKSEGIAINKITNAARTSAPNSRIITTYTPHAGRRRYDAVPLFRDESAGLGRAANSLPQSCHILANIHFETQQPDIYPLLSGRFEGKTGAALHQQQSRKKAAW